MQLLPLCETHLRYCKLQHNSAIVIYWIAAKTFLGPIFFKLWPLPSAICDMWDQSQPTTWCFPIHWECLQHHLLLPSIQVKHKIWLALTSSYELRFECHLQCLNYDDDHFDLTLIISTFYHFVFWAFLPCHWYFLKIYLNHQLCIRSPHIQIYQGKVV